MLKYLIGIVRPYLRIISETNNKVCHGIVGSFFFWFLAIEAIFSRVDFLVDIIALVKGSVDSLFKSQYSPWDNWIVGYSCSVLLAALYIILSVFDAKAISDKCSAYLFGIISER